MKYIPLEKVKASIGDTAFQKLIQDFAGNKIYIRKNYKDREERDKAIIDGYFSGIEREELAEMYGVSVSTIDKIKNRYSQKRNL